MTDEKTLPASKISYYKETDKLSNGVNGKREVASFSVESQNDEGALNLFRKLREEVAQEDSNPTERGRSN